MLLSWQKVKERTARETCEMVGLIWTKSSGEHSKKWHGRRKWNAWEMGQQRTEELVGGSVLTPNIPSLLLSPILEATLSYYPGAFFIPNSPRSIALDRKKAPYRLQSIGLLERAISSNC